MLTCHHATSAAAEWHQLRTEHFRFVGHVTAERLSTVANIQKTVGEYFKVRISDLLSKRRTRSIARPRQMAMALSKELTDHSLPEIGDAFGGRDHTTVIHACRKIAELRETDGRLREDYEKLLRELTT